MEALDKLNSYKLSSESKDHIKYTLDEYKEYLKKIDSLSEKDKELFLNVLKRNELINNQEMEHEDPFLVEMELNNQMNKGVPTTSIDVMSNFVLQNQNLDTRMLERVHRLVIRGTNDDKKENYDIRDFDTYVYEVVNGKEKVSYYAPNPAEIKPYLKKLYSFLREYNLNGELDILYKPILEHFYIAALQPFGNGNTRLARLLEYTTIFKLSRSQLGSKIQRPALYLSKNYFMTRGMYRDNIKKVVENPSDEQISKWIEYNLNMMDEQLYFSGNNLDKTIERSNRGKK